MSTPTATADFAFDYTRGSAVAKPAEAAKPAGQKGLLMRWFEKLAASRERAALAQIAMYDPRLAREIQIAKDRIDWTAE